MRNIKSFLLLLFIPFANSPIRYRQLTWADFKGKPTNDHLASTCSGIVIESDTAYAVFEPDKSWTRTNDVATLRHEQLHFTITELIAQSISRRTFDKVYVESMLEYWNKVETRYDFETKHGTNSAEQKKWEQGWIKL